jgi:carbon monoxide dehydrogenase subunit G
MFREKRTSANGCRRGVVAVIVALALVAVVGVVAVAVDGGLLYLELRRARATADAAAMAAACDLFKNYPTNNGTDPNGTAAAALSAAEDNGYNNDGTTNTVTVNIPPTSRIYAGQAGYVEVIVKTQVQRAFSRVWGSDTITVGARAVSRGAWVSPNAGVLILNYQGKGTLNAQGNGAFTETGGPVIVNSNNPSAVLQTGNAAMYAPEFDITGGVQVGGGANLATRPVAGQVFLGTHPTPDPLAYLPPPDPTTLPQGKMTTTSIAGGAQYVLTPGVYTNLPTFTSGDVVILQQASANNGGGIFYINGGGFKSTGASITMDPATTGGVMIYNAPASTALSEKIQITGNAGGTVNLGPLTNGPYAGMMLWQDRNSPVSVLVEGNGNFGVTGAFYAAGALLNINGNGTTSTGYYVDANNNQVWGSSQIGSQYISQDLGLGGNGNIHINYTGPKAARTRIIALVE